MSIKQNYHNEQMRDSKIDVLNQLKDSEMRKKLLHYQIPRLNGTQRGQKLFGETQNFNCNNNVFGGSNITYSSNLNSNDYEKYRKQMLQRRVDSLQAMKEEGVLIPPMVELSPIEGDEQASNMLLDKILRFSIEGTASMTIISDIYKYIKYLVDNIYFFDDYQKFIKLIDKFNAIYDGIKGSMIDYSNEISFLIESIINYIEFNMKGIGMDIKRRKIMAKSSIPLLRFNILDYQLKKIEKKEEAERIKAAKEAAKIFTSPPQPTPPLTPPSFETPPPTPPSSNDSITRPPTKLQMYKIFIIQKAVEAGITDETHIKEIERLAVNYLKINKRVLTENELEVLIQNYIDFMRQAPIMGDYDLNELD